MESQRGAPDRRELLAWFGASAGWLTLATGCATRSRGLSSPFVASDGLPSWSPVPLPLPIASDGGDAASDAGRLARFEVRDELVLPAGFGYEVLARWGERFGPEGSALEFGFNCDFLGFVPIAGSEDDAWLVVNHEALSARPWLQALAEVRGLDPVGLSATRAADGSVDVRLGDVGWTSDKLDLAASDLDPRVRERVQALSRLGLAELGISILRLKRGANGAWQVDVHSREHKRISGVDERTPTHSNCSGTVTPWGTALSGEENYQDYVRETIDGAGRPTATSMPLELVGIDARFAEPFDINGLGACLVVPQDGRDFGWVCHVDPATGALEKLRRLGRMRHENVALRVEPGQPLVAYTGDDRRGGHVWKFVSSRAVERVDDPLNVRLFDEGTLYAARFLPDGTGEWLPLVPATPLSRPMPERTGGGHLWLPDRSRVGADGIPEGGWVAVSAPGAKKQGVSVEEWCESVARACGKPFERLTLGDLVWELRDASVDAASREAHRERVLLLDAVVMANAMGATPCARPEDLELHPHDGSLFLSFSDATSLSSEGSPDARIFPQSRGNSSLRYGAIYRLEEEQAGASLRFRWSSFCQSGELADGGHGFANPDNLCFDPAGNLWVLTDISALALNAEVEREGTSAPGSDRFAGVFGSSALFMIPTAGPRAGIPHCFATGPAECELCGVTFSPDGETMFLSVQHPGELHGIRGRPGSGLPTSVERRIRVAARDGTLFEQLRTVPLGSNWPSGVLGRAPRPSVVAIRRRS
jgi:secreted PhoX family phosphatase